MILTTTKNFDRLDDQFEHFLDTILVEVVSNDLTPEKKAARRAAADKSDLEFCKIYFPSIFNFEWNDLHRWLAKLKSGLWTCSGFRKCGKSAFTYIAKAVKPLCLNVGGIININCRIQDISFERTAALKRLMFRNKLLCYDYDLALEQDLKGWYIIGKTHLIAGSVKTGLRNLIDDEFKRIRVSINDDLYNKETVNSAYDNAKVVDFIESEVAGQLEEGGLSITMGNSISETCPIVQLKNLHPDKHFSLPALDDNGASAWPEYKTAEQWENFRREMPWDIWLGEYMDQPSVKGDVFTPEMIHAININLVQIVASLSACDPSHGVSPAACDKAVATIGITNLREVIVQDIYLRKDSYLLLFDYVDELRRRLNHWKCLLFENDFNQWGFAEPYYREWMKTRNRTLPIINHLSSQLQTAHRGADKESRIMNLVHPHQTGMFMYSEKILLTKDFEKFRSQFLAFGRAKEKLDGLDALSTAYIMIFRYLESGGFKALKPRLFKQKETWWKKF
jgi:hypothetical protein